MSTFDIICHCAEESYRDFYTNMVNIVEAHPLNIKKECDRYHRALTEHLGLRSVLRLWLRFASDTQISANHVPPSSLAQASAAPRISAGDWTCRGSHARS